jgi:hypothetical protein
LTSTADAHKTDGAVSIFLFDSSEKVWHKRSSKS